MTYRTIMTTPKAVVVLSGKRKSGKDYVANRLQERLGCQICTIMRLSAPLKSQYAKEHNLDFDRLLDASDYKERYRADMIRWGEERRHQDSSFFCRLATEMPGADKPVWIISDARRLTDLHYFRTHYPQTIAVRINADDTVRRERGFSFTQGYGMWINKQTTFINASVCSNMYKPDHDPIVFDLPLPSGYTREDFAQLSTETLRQAQKQTDMAEQCEQLTRSGKDANHVATDSFIKRVIGEE